MLTQKPNINVSSRSQQTKCGEIYFLANNLRFVCVICELEIESYLEFSLHFQNLHFIDFAGVPKNENEENFANPLAEETLQSLEHLKTISEEFTDPLNWPCDSNQDYEKGIHENTKILCNELNSLTTNKAVDVELHSGKREDNLTLDIESDYRESSCNSSNVGDNISSIDFKIDWDEPYKPAQNHSKRPYKPRDKPNACTYCGRTFRRRYQLDTHLNIHTGAQPHQCEICGRRFRALTTLQRHLNTHEKKKDFACQFCDKSFTHRAALLSHETRHVQKRNISCDECEKKFYTINHCDTHKRRVHEKSNKTLPSLPFACDICTNRYRSASMLSTHKSRKHFKTANFMCDKCDKKFVNQQKLEEHQKIHINKVEAMCSSVNST